MPPNALRLLIVDDEPLARVRLRMLLAECGVPDAAQTPEATQAEQAWALLQQQTFDVVLLDIHMPGMDGLTLAKRLAQLPHAVAVVFVTAYPEHAVDAFELDAVDYLTKPVRRERLAHALEKAAAWLEQQRASHAAAPAFLLITDRGRTERVPLSEVVYIKAELKYLTVRTPQRTHILDGSLNELEADQPTHWLRIHRNALVPRHLLRALEKTHDPVEGEAWFVRLQGVDERLQVSRRQLAAVREALAVAAGPRDSIPP
ncbi:MAG: hypothetical protein RI959_398 [Pseudomonadota bacterium]|jgi:two-component system response regulator AlgR